MPSLRPFAAYIEDHQEEIIQRLSDAVAIPSISADPERRLDVFKMASWLQAECESLGVHIRSIPMGKHFVGDIELDLPPVLFGTYGNDPQKKTILSYAHYDVQPAAKEDGWKHDPFVLTEEDGKLYGRGSTDDKGPLLGWLNVIEAHRKTNTEFPVNLKFIFEGMEESGSEGLDDLIFSEASAAFLADVDGTCISDNYWIGTQVPCLTYGLRGLSYFKVSISGPKSDLHSGIFGGSVHEPMTDLFSLFSKLVTPSGRILIPGISESVAPLTEEERARYGLIDITVKDIESAVGAPVTVSQDKATLLMARMRYPSLSIHGIEGGFSGIGAKTVIPAAVHGKFSIRLVPNQTPEAIDALVQTYLKAEFAKLGSKNSFAVEMLSGGKPWVEDINSWNFRAASKATETIYNQVPNYTREGGSIPVALTFSEATGKSVMLLPLGQGDDGAHGPGEKIARRNYIEGSKLLGEYLHEVAAVME